MGEEVPDWQTIWGAKVKTPVDVPDNILKDAITAVIRELDSCDNFESSGKLVAQKIKVHRHHWEGPKTKVLEHLCHAATFF